MSSRFDMLPPTMGLADLVKRGMPGGVTATPPVWGGQPLGGPTSLGGSTPLGGPTPIVGQATSFSGQSATPSYGGPNATGAIAQPTPDRPGATSAAMPPTFSGAQPQHLPMPSFPMPAPPPMQPTPPHAPTTPAPMPPTPMPPSAAPPQAQAFYGGATSVPQNGSMRLGDMMRRRQTTRRPGLY